MKKVILIIVTILLHLISIPVFAKQEVNPDLTRRPLLQLKKNSAVVYLPTKLVIGKDNKIIVKGEPGYFVSLAISSENSGSMPFYGKILRLGKDFNTVENTISQSGIAEMNIKIPDDKNLNDKTYFIEVAVWKDANFRDLQLAELIAPNGRKTNYNGIKLGLPPKDVSGPAFTPSIPGISPDVLRSIKTIEKLKNGDESSENREFNSDYEYMNPYQTPVMLKNLHSIDMQKK